MHKAKSAIPITPMRCVAGDPSTHKQRAHGGATFAHVCDCGAVQYQNTHFPFWSEKGPWHRPELDVGWPRAIPWMEWNRIMIDGRSTGEEVERTG
jgi:hypothetical protein